MYIQNPGKVPVRGRFETADEGRFCKRVHDDSVSGRGREVIVDRVQFRTLAVVNCDWDHVGCRAVRASF